MNLSGIFGHILGTTALIFSAFIFPHHTSAVAPIAVVTPTIEKSSYIASSTYTYDGYTIAANLYIPKNGGKVEGNITGACTGNITGTYDVVDNGKISGKAQAVCHVFLFSVPVAGTYSGVVDESDKKLDVTIDVKADSFEKSQQITLSLE